MTTKNQNLHVDRKNKMHPRTTSAHTSSWSGAVDDEKSVLILSGVRGETRRYRTFHPFEQLRLAGANCMVSHITDPDLPAKLARASVVIFHRTTYDAFVDQLFRTVHSQHMLAILDVDDLVFDPEAMAWIASPDFQDPVRARLYREDLDRNRTTLGACHAVTASTHYLAEQVRTIGKPVWIHRNAFSMEMLAKSEQAVAIRQPNQGRVVIGYASGTPTHDLDFQVAKPSLISILKRYPDTELWLVGPLNPGSDWGGLGDRIRHHRLVPWRKLPELLVQFDVNLAPLVTDNPFSQSKSEIKYMEAALVRVPTIASPTEAFRFAIRSGENGLLAADQVDWSDGLAELIQHSELRQQMGERAYQDVLDRYHPRVRSQELVNTLNQIHVHASGRPLWTRPPSHGLPIPVHKNDPFGDPIWLSETVEQDPTLARMAWYSLRHRGAHTLLKQLWIYFRRLISPIFPFRKVS